MNRTAPETPRPADAFQTVDVADPQAQSLLVLLCLLGANPVLKPVADGLSVVVLSGGNGCIVGWQDVQ